jgi:RNA polymerase sigma factor (sigma-70 family)
MKLFSAEDSHAQASLDDVELFAQLLAAHKDKLYRVAFRMTGHAEDAQDLLQDALVEAYRSFKKFQRGSYFDKWLYRIMTNTFIDRQRHRTYGAMAKNLGIARFLIQNRTRLCRSCVVNTVNQCSELWTA